jgi:hypothetical protein
VNQIKQSEIESTISRAQAAFESGKLNQYKPLQVTGSDGVKTTSPTSWGPAMRR